MQQLERSPFRGHLFENFIITDLHKQCFNLGTKAPLYFWRDKNGSIEIDCLVNQGSIFNPIEIKSGETINPSFFDGLKKWYDISGTDPERGYLVHGGDLSQSRSVGNIVSWKDSGSLISQINSSE